MRPDILIINTSFQSIPDGLNSGCLLAKNGLFVFRRLCLGERPFIEAVKKLGPGYEAEGMADYQESLAIHGPKIGRENHFQTEAFFRAVWREHHSEAVVFLYFAPTLGKWRFVAVPQKVRAGHLDWETPGATPNGWYLVGSYHSHGQNMRGFHSPTDDGDELNWNGVHVTIGNIIDLRPSYAASIVIDGQRFEVPIEDLVEPAEEVEFPSRWMEQVSKYVPPQPVVVAGQRTGWYQGYGGRGGEE